MFARYDHDLHPFFERLEVAKQARKAARRQKLRESWANLLSHVGLAVRRG